MQVFERARAGLLPHRGDFMVRQLGKQDGIRADFGDHEMAKVFEQVTTQAARVITILIQIPGQPQRLGRVARQHGLDHAK